MILLLGWYTNKIHPALICVSLIKGYLKRFINICVVSDIAVFVLFISRTAVIIIFPIKIRTPCELIISETVYRKRKRGCFKGKLFFFLGRWISSNERETLNFQLATVRQNLKPIFSCRLAHTLEKNKRTSPKQGLNQFGWKIISYAGHSSAKTNLVCRADSPLLSEHA